MSKQKTALITGGNSGIGLETAKLFKTNGYETTIVGRNKESTVKAAKENGFNYIIADLNDLDSLETVIEPFSDGLDVLVNNAGVAGIVPIEHLTIESIAPAFTVNVYAIFYLIKLLIPALEKNNGAIVNVSSIIVNNGKPGMSVYAATKGAVEGMTKSLAQELAAKKIRVNAVSPGAIDTPVIEKFGIPPEQIDVLKAQQAAAIPVQRFGQAEEVAQVILAQAEATYVNGSVWTVDGGVDAS